MAKRPISSQISAVRLASRALVNPAANIMRGNERKLLVDDLAHAVRTLEWLQRNMADVRAFVAAKGGAQQ